MHCDLSRSPDSWLAPVQVLTHYSNVRPIDECGAVAGGGGMSSASGWRAGWRQAYFTPGSSLFSSSTEQEGEEKKKKKKKNFFILTILDKSAAGTGTI